MWRCTQKWDGHVNFNRDDEPADLGVTRFKTNPYCSRVHIKLNQRFHALILQPHGQCVQCVWWRCLQFFGTPTSLFLKKCSPLATETGYPSIFPYDPTIPARLWRLWLRSQSSRSAALAACPSALHWAERVSFEREGEPVVFMVDIGVVLF